MSRRRFIADAVDGDRAMLTGAHAAHLSRVLRARVGQEFDIAADGRVRRGRVVTVTTTRVEFELGEDVPSATLAPVTLYLAITKFDRLEWAIEKCTELGAARIIPVIAARTDAHLVAAAQKRTERWRRLAAQAAEQSRRVTPPEICAPLRLNRAVLAIPGTRIVLAESEHHRSLKEALKDLLALGQAEDQLPSTPGLVRSDGGSSSISRGHPEKTFPEVALALGPEGGWTDLELNWFSESGWMRATLGPTVLRAETAAIAALAIVLSELHP
jgi:16S rRNA (uracil1498-N3)-methyltransferase